MANKRSIKILVTEYGQEVAVDPDEISMIHSVSVPRHTGRRWELYLKSGVTVVVDNDIPLRELLEFLGMVPDSHEIR